MPASGQERTLAGDSKMSGSGWKRQFMNVRYGAGCRAGRHLSNTLGPFPSAATAAGIGRLSIAPLPPRHSIQRTVKTRRSCSRVASAHVWLLSLYIPRSYTCVNDYGAGIGRT